MRIVLATLNARWIHASFGLRYLWANLGAFKESAQILEFTNTDRPLDVAEAIAACEPDVVGIGVYVWNAEQSLQLVQMLKRVLPQAKIVIGGPEVSHETAQQPICEIADHIVIGEADLTFAALCEQLHNGDEVERVISGPAPSPQDLVLPYDAYDDQDIAQRVLYVEASRGCPFRCEFCLSSIDRGVRAFDVDPFLEQMQRLYDRGARTFKFVDRTFNLRADVSSQILRFFLRQPEPTFAHFEMIPDRFPDELRDIVRQFEPGRLQFEVGIQTFNPDVAKRISRRQNYDRIDENLTFLRDETSVHVHADLIVGLPGESAESFARGFDTLVALGPQEIQVGMLKRLRGTPIVRHDDEYRMVWSPIAPYELLHNRDLDFATMQHLRRFARYWDLIASSGNFRDTLQLLWADRSPFEAFSKLTRWLWARTGATHRIALRRLVALLFEHLTPEVEPDVLGPTLLRDYQRPGRSDVPPPLEPWAHLATVTRAQASAATPRRQQRHAGE